MIGCEDIRLLRIELFQPGDFDLDASQKQSQFNEEPYRLKYSAFLLGQQKQPDNRRRNQCNCRKPESAKKDAAKSRHHAKVPFQQVNRLLKQSITYSRAFLYRRLKKRRSPRRLKIRMQAMPTAPRTLSIPGMPVH